jgi:hypothetical protein
MAPHSTLDSEELADRLAIRELIDAYAARCKWTEPERPESAIALPTTSPHKMERTASWLRPFAISTRLPSMKADGISPSAN